MIYEISKITDAYEAGSIDYASTVKSLVDVYVTGGPVEKSFAPLLYILGCRTAIYDPQSHYPDRVGQRVDALAPTGSDHEALITETLLTLLRLHAGNSPGYDPHSACSLLGGLYRNNRWRACLGTITAANNLAVLLLDAILTWRDFTAVHPIYLRGLPGFSPIHAMLNAWVAPVQPFSEKTAMAEVACAIFGDAWYDLTFGDESWFSSSRDNKCSAINRTITFSIWGTHPLFRPGLLSPNAVQQEGIALPQMDMQ